MNKFKEWLEKAAQDKIDNYEDAWDIVGILNKFNELTKDKTFIEVPKEVKLSEVSDFIYDNIFSIGKVFINKTEKGVIVEFVSREKDKVVIYIDKNNHIWNYEISESYKFRYQKYLMTFMVGETKIINDLKHCHENSECEDCEYFDEETFCNLEEEDE